MIRFKVVTVDMFQTLVDVNSLRYYFWEEVLGKHYPEAMADEYGNQWGKLFPDFFNQIVGRTDDFLTLKPIFECFWAIFFEQMNRPAASRGAVHFNWNFLNNRYKKFAPSRQTKFILVLIYRDSIFYSPKLANPAKDVYTKLKASLRSPQPERLPRLIPPQVGRRTHNHGERSLRRALIPRQKNIKSAGNFGNILSTNLFFT